jgi:hypothetical protein
MNTNPHQSLLDIPKDILFKVIEVCELDLLYSMYLVNKLFQQIIKDMKLLPPLWICSVKDPDMCKDSWENLESSTKDFLSHQKFLQEIKHCKLGFLTHEELLYLFDNPQLISMDFLSHHKIHEELLYLFNNPRLISMVNMLEIDTYILRFGYGYQPILEKALQFPNITMLSLVDIIITSRNFSKICSKSPTLQYLNLRDGILSSLMDFSTCSFVNFSLDNMNCKSGTYIRMPHCLKKCDLSCYLVEGGLLPNSFIKFQMSHCKDLKTL